MRKKELINENKIISEELQRIKIDNDALTIQLNKKLEEIDLLYKKVEELNTLLAAKIKELSEVLEENASLKAKMVGIEEDDETQEEQDILEYGAVIIGKVIVSGAEYTIRMESDDQERIDAFAQEILDRVESVKREVLSIIFSDISYDRMCQLMEHEYQSAINFFDRVVARV